jgi:hypothetical protein
MGNRARNTLPAQETRHSFGSSSAAARRSEGPVTKSDFEISRIIEKFCSKYIQDKNLHKTEETRYFA